jgi:hypothetical protein
MNPIHRKGNRVEMNSNDHRGAKGGLRRLRRPRLLTCAAVLSAAAALSLAAGAAAGQPSLDRPTGLQTFKLRPGDSAIGIPFSRTPSFAWTPVRGATRYELELATDKYFDADNSVVWSSNSLATPAASVPISLPWITASLFWRVRASGPLGVSQWSNPSHFPMRWTTVPNRLPAGPGYVRWSTVDGATAYQVWFVGLGKVFTTITNVADEREYYLPGKVAPQSVLWRVRAVRQVYGTRANAFPAVSFGPWSPMFTSAFTPATTTSALQVDEAVSDVVSTAAHPTHKLVPAFTVNGNPPAPATLYRVYVYSDRDCVNRLFTGYPVASPAYAPRSTGGPVLPAGMNRMADGTTVTPNEVTKGAPAKIDLWDNLGGHYYAVAVPVVMKVSNQAASQGSGSTATASSKTYVYQDTELPQDVCQAGHFITFSKSSSAPVVTADGQPTATGLSPSGRLLASTSWKPSFYGSPLIAWQPASGALGYEVQWSKSAYPWQTAGSIRTAATSAMLPVRPGSWWYRVRGIDPSLPGNRLMTWSAQVPLVVTRPTYGVVGG